eukprot:gene6300-10306_t
MINKSDFKQTSDDLLIKGYSKIDNFLKEDCFTNLKKEIIDLEKTMKEEPSTETNTKTGETILIDKNPILARKIKITDEDANTCKNYIQNLSTELSKGLNEFLPKLKLTPAKKELDFNKIACCCGEGVKLPKHFDNGGYDPDDYRKLTAILYFNEEWKEEYGGILRLYPYSKSTSEFVDYLPIANRLVLFYSDYMVHEVMKTTKKLQQKRYTMTVWLSTENANQIHNDRFLFREICLKHFQPK